MRVKKLAIVLVDLVGSRSSCKRGRIREQYKCLKFMEILCKWNGNFCSICGTVKVEYL